MTYPQPTIETIHYNDYLTQIPQKGRHILAQQTDDKILVYQAFNHSIANFALENQYFGGSNYRYTRMSWIKPNFLWMMYRCGWSEKENQERVLGIWLKKVDFDFILSQSVFANYQEVIYTNRENWKAQLSQKPVRLQWDPDHDIYGDKQERRAIQLGLKGDVLAQFGKEMVSEIIDLTSFVKAQKKKIDERNIDELLVPQESIYLPQQLEIEKQIGLGNPPG